MSEEQITDPVLNQEDQKGIGESSQAQLPPMSTVARERMMEIIVNNTKVIEDSSKMLALMKADPTLDASFCRLFGIQRQPKMVDVSK